MSSNRLLLDIGIVVSALAFGLMACSETSDSENKNVRNTNQNEDDNSYGGEDDLSEQTCGSDDLDVDLTDLKCTEDELVTYASCLEQNCQATDTECFGSIEETDGGACGEWTTCTAKCGCDPNCIANCPKSEPCNTCLSKLDECKSTCTMPDCMKPSEYATRECKDLEECCYFFGDEQTKKTCLDELKATNDDASACKASFEKLCE